MKTAQKPATVQMQNDCKAAKRNDASAQVRKTLYFGTKLFNVFDLTLFVRCDALAAVAKRHWNYISW